MLSVPASRPNAYTGSTLDRVSIRRDDAEWIEIARQDPAARFLPVWRSRSLMSGLEAGAPRAVALSVNDLPTTRGWALLGLDEGRPVFAVDLPPEADAPTFAGCSFADLRQVAGLLPGPEASLLAHARGLMHWRARHGFCGACGAGCTPRSAGNAMVCTGCGAQHFPRTDPAVIMLVVRGDRCLLGHSTRFPAITMYSTLAGFVEPGESLEEAVRRETLEETDILVGEVRYHSSQPWPFPSSIMLGFHAEGLSDTITIDPKELRDARWFTRAELMAPETHGFSLPRVDSIARRLIEDWLDA